MARDGSIGTATFEAVNKLTATGMNKQQAFNTYAEETGARPGTVAANFYRVARAEGAVKPRKRRRTSAKATPSRKPSNGRRAAPRASRQAADMETLLASLVGSVTELAEALKAQQAETAELRSRLDGVRSALD